MGAKPDWLKITDISGSGVEFIDNVLAQNRVNLGIYALDGKWYVRIIDKHYRSGNESVIAHSLTLQGALEELEDWLRFRVKLTEVKDDTNTKA